MGTSEFGGQRALIVGGSRGLGELTSKLLALGGADVRLTYYQGAQDAEAIVSDIAQSGGIAAAFGCDVIHPQESVAHMCKDGWSPTHLYFFATPFISVQTRWPQAFSDDAFRRFCDYYVTGFVTTFLLLAQSLPSWGTYSIPLP